MKQNGKVINGDNRIAHYLEQEGFAEEISTNVVGICVVENVMDLVSFDNTNRFTNKLTVPYSLEMAKVVGLTTCNVEDRNLLKDTIYNHLVKNFHLY